MGVPRFFGDNLPANQTLSVGVNAGILPATGVANAHVAAAAAIAGSKLAANARKRFCQAIAKLDLSGAAQADVPLLHPTVPITLVKATFLYTEASSADAGVAVTIGKEGSAAFFYTGDSEINKAAWYEKDLTLLQTALTAGDTLVCGNAGGKAGTGEILVCVEYTVND